MANKIIKYKYSSARVTVCKMSKRKIKISVIGLGYVGLPLAVAFAKYYSVVGFDKNPVRIEGLQRNYDFTNEISSKQLSQINFKKTCDEKDIKGANFHIIAVPTPVTETKRPDLEPLRVASETIGRQLSLNDIVVYESTVYPGVTEDFCVPIIEKASGMKCGLEWKIGYSPERINPGDKEHTLDKIVKVVAGMDAETTGIIAKVYGKVVRAGIFPAANIKTAELAKALENTQRDVNIALMNELSKFCGKLGLDTKEVLETARTKWNFLPFEPGLVGGHCIGVDPYYLTEKAHELGYHPEVIVAGRRINDSMGDYVAELTLQAMIEREKQIKKSTVLIMGMTFKENIPDYRNSRVEDIIKKLKQYGICVIGHDPFVQQKELFGVPNVADYSTVKSDAVIFAVKHKPFYSIKLTGLRKQTDILIDVKWIFSKEEAEQKGFRYIRI